MTLIILCWELTELSNPRSWKQTIWAPLFTPKHICFKCSTHALKLESDPSMWRYLTHHVASYLHLSFQTNLRKIRAVSDGSARLHLPVSSLSSASLHSTTSSSSQSIHQQPWCVVVIVRVSFCSRAKTAGSYPVCRHVCVRTDTICLYKWRHQLLSRSLFIFRLLFSSNVLTGK